MQRIYPKIKTTGKTQKQKNLGLVFAERDKKGEEKKRAYDIPHNHQP